MRNREALTDDTQMQRRGKRQPSTDIPVLDRLDVDLMPYRAYLLGELCAANSFVGFEHLSDLSPRGLHVAFLVFLNDLRSEARRHPPLRIEIELVNPVVVGVQVGVVSGFEQALGQRVPPPVERGGDQGIGILADVFDQCLIRAHVLLPDDPDD